MTPPSRKRKIGTFQSSLAATLPSVLHDAEATHRANENASSSNPFGPAPDPENVVSESLGGIKRHRVSLGFLMGGGMRELQELLTRVRVIEDECLDEQKQEEGDTDRDEFVAIKKRMFHLLMDVRALVRGRHALQLEQGNTVEVIRKGALINSKLELLDSLFLKLKEAFKRQSKSRNKKIADEVLDQRFAEMQVLKRQIDESTDMHLHGHTYASEEIKTLTEFETAQLMASQLGIPPVEWRDPTEEENRTIDRWYERDKDFDRQVGLVGEAVDDLGHVALHIGEKAQAQKAAISRLHGQADVANEDLRTINDRVREVMLRQKGMNFCLKLFMAVILIGLVAFIGTQIQRRLVRA